MDLDEDYKTEWKFKLSKKIDKQKLKKKKKGFWYFARYSEFLGMCVGGYGLHQLKAIMRHPQALLSSIMERGQALILYYVYLGFIHNFQSHILLIHNYYR